MISSRYKIIFKYTAIGVVIFFIGLQCIPSSFDRTNPPVTGAPNWNSPETKATFMIACADCHSNETRFPWYSRIAPGSWLIEKDIRNGRRHFNVSEWDRSQRGGEDAAEEVQRGSMPIGPYLLLHPATNFTVAEKHRFVNGLQLTFGGANAKDMDNETESDE